MSFLNYYGRSDVAAGQSRSTLAVRVTLSVGAILLEAGRPAEAETVYWMNERERRTKN
jgi:hypothetical protein